MGRWRGTGETYAGGGITSEAGGSWKVRFNTARPPGSASSRKLAWRLCFQKLTTWENWCWAKAWAVGDQGAGGVIVGDQPPTGHKDPAEASTKSWQWARDLLLPLASRPTETLQSLLRSVIKLFKLGRLDIDDNEVIMVDTVAWLNEDRTFTCRNCCVF